MRSRNMTNEQKKRDKTREIWVTNDIHDRFLRPFRCEILLITIEFPQDLLNIVFLRFIT